MANLRTKFFESRQYWVRGGEDVTQWQRLDTPDIPVDQQINEWLQAEGVQLMSATAPGIYHYWLDTEGLQKCVIIGVMVSYAPALAEQMVAPPAAAPPAFGGPTNDGSRKPVAPARAAPRSNMPTINIRRPNR